MRRLLIVGFGDIAQRMVPLLAGLAHDVTHLAPPADRGARDTRTAHRVAALAKGGSLPQHFVYV